MRISQWLRRLTYKGFQSKCGLSVRIIIMATMSLCSITATAQRRPKVQDIPGEDVGRYVVKTVEYRASGFEEGRDGMAGAGPFAMLIKIDTVTGRTWQYRAAVFMAKGKPYLSQYAWVPLAEEHEDIFSVLRKSDEARAAETK